MVASGTELYHTEKRVAESGAGDARYYQRLESGLFEYQKYNVREVAMIAEKEAG